MRRSRLLCPLGLLLAAGSAPAAEATPVEGMRSTVEITFTTTAPGSPTGFTYSASFRDPASPGADPPPLRRLVITGAEGSQIDTGATERCAATDAQLKQEGEAACPDASRIGAGMARVKPILFPAVDYRATLFNADHDQLELLSGDPPAPPVVVHGFIRGDVVDSPIPTCINGGYVPEDCPDDQAALLSNTLTVPALVTGGEGSTRSYLTTPPVCPVDRAWRTPVDFHYGDGVVETLVTEQPCERPTIVVRPRAPKRRRARGLAVSVRVVGAPQVEGLRAALRRIRPGDRVSRVLGRVRSPVTVDGRRVVSLRLRRPGLRPGRYEVAVRADGVDRVTRRFRARRGPPRPAGAARRPDTQP